MYFRYQGVHHGPGDRSRATALAYALDGMEENDGQQRDGWRPDGGWGSDSGGIGGTTVLVIVLLLVVLLPLGLAAFHPSPYVYQPNKQVTDAQIDGYGSAFEYRQSDVQFAGIRGGPERYVDYHYGTNRARETLNFPGTGSDPNLGVRGRGTTPNTTRTVGIWRRPAPIDCGRLRSTTGSDTARRAFGHDATGVKPGDEQRGFRLHYVPPEEQRSIEADAAGV